MPTVRVAVITHKFGVSTFLALTTEQLSEKVAEWCNDNRKDARYPDKVENLFETGDYDDCIEEYFDENENESIDYDTSYLEN